MQLDPSGTLTAPLYTPRPAGYGQTSTVAIQIDEASGGLVCFQGSVLGPADVARSASAEAPRLFQSKSLSEFGIEQGAIAWTGCGCVLSEKAGSEGMVKKIAVVGGGPKAAAICAKVDCLRRAGTRIEVAVFEKSKWGAAWSGAHGYTDGRQRLCTPAERDVGFPYQAGLLTAEQTADLYARFSWVAYLLAKAATGRSYLDWVDRGRRPPTHAEFAAYIGWVIERADIDRELREVIAIERSRGKWIAQNAGSGDAPCGELSSGMTA